MLKVLFTFCILLVSIGFGAGFEPGSNVIITKNNGKVISGVIKKVRANAKFECIDDNGKLFKIPTHKVEKITAKKGMRFLNVLGSYKHKVAKLKLINGESVFCGITKSITLDIINPSTHKSHPFTVTDQSKYSSAKIVDTLTQTSKGIIIELNNGQRIEVPVAKEDIKSIIFN